MDMYQIIMEDNEQGIHTINVAEECFKDFLQRNQIPMFNDPEFPSSLEDMQIKVKAEGCPDIYAYKMEMM